jgi:cell division protease FtsH
MPEKTDTKNTDKNNIKQNIRRVTAHPRKSNNWWRYLIWFFLLVLIVSFLFRGSRKKQITYTDFREDAKNGNIASVVFLNHKIEGKFTDEYLKKNKKKNLSSGFVTRIPVIQGSDLITFLENHNVKINAEKAEHFPWTLVLFMAPWILLIGYFVYAGHKLRGKMGGGGLGLFNVGKSKAKLYRKSNVETHFDDVAGLDNAKKDLREIIDYLKNPVKFLSLGAEVPRGILLTGPPGCGKTLLAKAVAGEIGVPFYHLSGSEFIEMFVGVGASRVRDMFDNAKKDAPSIIFIDEIDSIGRSRGTGLGGGHDEREQTLNQILSEMDGFEPHQPVVVIAATNRPDVLDPALIRPGRFDRQITLPLPDKKARKKIFEIHIRNVPTSQDLDLDNFAARTVGFSGADIKNLVNEATLMAGRKNKKIVEKEDFDSAWDKAMLGMEREDILEEEEKKLVSYHESGHALIAQLLPDTDPLQKVTIIPHGHSLGSTEQVPEIDRHNFTRNYLLGVIAVRLAGRMAEKLFTDDISNGAADDLKKATHLARRMVCQWGMSENLGPMTFSQAEDHVFLGREMTKQRDYSEETARRIDVEVKNLLTQQEQRVAKLLQENRDLLQKLASALLENETLEKQQIIEILGAKQCQVKNNGGKKAQIEHVGRL